MKFYKNAAKQLNKFKHFSQKWLTESSKLSRALF